MAAGKGVFVFGAAACRTPVRAGEGPGILKKGLQKTGTGSK
jgi:hypothetical protein